jgi:hypothetical protein
MARITGNIYQLSVTLQDITPPVWRRLLVRSETQLSRLHDVLQLVMGWTDSHLHEFELNGRLYRAQDLDDGELEDSEDETRVRLAHLLHQPGDTLLYVYDFGDWWRHDLVVEQIFPADPEGRYPFCLAGARACRQKTVGGRRGTRNW